MAVTRAPRPRIRSIANRTTKRFSLKGVKGGLARDRPFYLPKYRNAKIACQLEIAMRDVPVNGEIDRLITCDIVRRSIFRFV